MEKKYCFEFTLLALGLLEFVVACLFLPERSAGVIAFYCAASAFSLFVAYVSLFIIREENNGVRNFIKLFLLSGLVGFLLEALTLIGALLASPFDISDWNIKRLVAFAAMFYSLVVLWRFYSGDDFCSSLISYFKKSFALVRTFAAANKIRVVVLLMLLALLPLLFSVVAAVLKLSVALSAVFGVAVWAIVVSVTMVFIYGESWLHYAVFLMSVSFGLVFICAFPASVLYSWDDQTHYKRAQSLSFFADVEMTPSDSVMSELFLDVPEISGDVSFHKYPITSANQWSSVEVKQLSDELNDAYCAGNAYVLPGVSNTAVSYSSIAYLPSAIGIWLGRLLHLPFTSIVVLGRLFNLLFYSYIAALAVCIAPAKKTLFAVISLLPTVIFMAANYSYDPWILSLILLAVAQLMRLLLGKDASVSFKEASLVLLTLFLALAPKAIYFPLLGLLFLISKKKFKNSHEYRMMCCSVVVVGLLVLATFLLPLFVSGGGYVADARGGEDVNSREQMLYVVSHPFEYLNILGNFVFTQLLPIGFVERGMTNLAYLGDLSSFYPYSPGLTPLFCVAVSILDSNKQSTELVTAPRRIWSLVLVLVTIALICTALYVSFTPVSSDTIAGVQARYLLPLLPVFGVFVMNFKSIYQGEKNRLSAGILGLSGIVVALTTWLLLVSRFSLLAT